MIIDISDSQFRRIVSDSRFSLPIRWEGEGFLHSLNELYDAYLQIVIQESEHPEEDRALIDVDISSIRRVCGGITEAVKQYLNGFPADAFAKFSEVMRILVAEPLKVYQKSVLEQFEASEYARNAPLNLYRAARVADNKPYPRTRIFHTPFSLRSKVSTSRYSIAGYPSLYLSTSLELCCEEIHVNQLTEFVIASAFKLERSAEYSGRNIRVIELAIKPQDFLKQDIIAESGKRIFPKNFFEQNAVKQSFLLWYPLIAASSFIRATKKDPFAAEYIIPQLLMQWVRWSIYDKRELIGIRYFSCASVKASEMGFNYVFPTSGNDNNRSIPFCAELVKSFRLTDPVYIHEYPDLGSCEHELLHHTFDYIYPQIRTTNNITASR